MDRTCASCGRSEYSKGLCLSCYRKAYRLRKKGVDVDLPPKVPSKCHPDRKNYGHGLCRSCWRKDDYRKKKGVAVREQPPMPTDAQRKQMNLSQLQEARAVLKSWLKEYNARFELDVQRAQQQTLSDETIQTLQHLSEQGELNS